MKTKLRKEILNKRNNQSDAFKTEASKRIGSFVIEFIEDILKETKNNKTTSNILLYSSYGSEVITDSLIDYYLKSDNIAVALPRVNGSEMDFYQINSRDELEKGSFNILEPSHFIERNDKFVECNDKFIERSDKFIEDNDEYFERPVYIPETDNDIIIVPGVVFDRNKNRIGYGKGYYDRYFDRYPIKNRIGICYDCQLVEDISYLQYNTDIPLSKIITPSGVIE